MSILKKMKSLSKTVVTESRVEMTPKQVKQCSAALRSKNRGYNVQPNRFDVKTPYRVSINYQNEWHNFGNFTSDDVAAAVGAIISVAFFGEEKAKAGDYDEKIVEKHPEFLAWIADERNAEVLAMANGEATCIHAGGTLTKVVKTNSEAVIDEENSF